MVRVVGVVVYGGVRVEGGCGSYIGGWVGYSRATVFVPNAKATAMALGLGGFTR